MMLGVLNSLGRSLAGVVTTISAAMGG